jgi:hypothetical protein
MKDQNGWKIRTNDELQVMYGKPNINNNRKMTRTRVVDLRHVKDP